jgi:ATPase subunit of ABC transporter with duplicated ATPase domains
MLQVNQLTVEVAGRIVVDRATFSLHAGDKVGLVGRNGAGKTSLLKVLAGRAPGTGGEAVCRGALGYLDQDPRLKSSAVDVTGLTHIIAGRGLDASAARLEKLRLVLEKSPTTNNVARFSRAEERFRTEGGYSAESEARRIAAGLGISGDRLDRPVKVLSGGERRRVELARILFAGSDVLLLDEPTNHLDTDAKTWLMRFLGSYRGALLVVSHDLVLLDEAITRILHLDESHINEYRGTYSQYRTARKEDEARLGKLAGRQQAEIRRLSTLADSMRGQTVRRARVAKSIDTRVEKLKTRSIVAPKGERQITVRFPEPPRSGDIALDVTDVSKDYGGPPIFEDITFTVGRGERLMILGFNGAGKTSLLRMIAGETSFTQGDIRIGVNVSLGYYAQEHEGITANKTVFDHMRSQSGVGDQQLRGLLGMFGLSGEMAFQDAGTLSGGEKTKLALAQLVAGRHNLLLLDEPTNNLDPPSLAAVAHALAAWPGTMIIVSHDTEFVRELRPQRVLMMPEGTLDYWGDDLLELVALS